jgi:multidrug efflux pump subunit AcrA (membrane-fusion protein)
MPHRAIVYLTVHTEGGIVEPGQRILDIVMQGDKLNIEAQVIPDDIDRVFPGRMLTVSGDRLTDRVTGQPYFLARI